jgi:hypothetical protein
LSLLVVRVGAVNRSFRNWRVASQRLVSDFLQTTSSDVFLAYIIDLPNLVRHVDAIFLEFLNAIESFFLKQLIHTVESLIVFMEPRRLFFGKDKLLLLEVMESSKVVSISLKLTVLLLDIFSKCLLILKISSESRNFAVPEIKLVLLRILSLAKHVNFLLERLDLLSPVRQFTLEVVDFGCEHLPVRIES